MIAERTVDFSFLFQSMVVTYATSHAACMPDRSLVSF